MKFRQISYLMAGLLSYGAQAQAQEKMPATNAPAAVPSTNATPAEVKPAEAPDKGQLSYAVGVYYADFMTNDLMRKIGLEPKVELDWNRLLAAYSNVMAGVPTTMDSQGAIKILQQQAAYQRDKVQEEIKKMTALGPENKAKGEKFMEEMEKTPGVTKLASGVVYKVIKAGDGEMPTTNDMATVSFRASLIDGTEVVKMEHKPLAVTPPGIPVGLSEALTLMKAGSHWTIYLPYIQAFGEQTAIPDAKHKPQVGPYSALVFDMELESVQHRPAQPAGPAQGMRSGGPMTMPPGTMVAPPVTSSSIVRVPSAEDMARGEKPRVLTDAEIEAAKAEAAKQAQTNAAGPK